MSVMANPLDTYLVTELERGGRGIGGSVASSRGLLSERKILGAAGFHVLESHRISHAC